ETPEAFLDFWGRKGKDAALAAIEKHFGDQPDHDEIVDIYKYSRGRVANRFWVLGKTFKAQNIPAFFNDQAMYDFVRTQVQRGCVRYMRVNLLERTGIEGINHIASTWQVPIRAFYVSNAETYWETFNDTYRENVATL